MSPSRQLIFAGRSRDGRRFLRKRGVFGATFSENTATVENPQAARAYTLFLQAAERAKDRSLGVSRSFPRRR